MRRAARIAHAKPERAGYQSCFAAVRKIVVNPPGHHKETIPEADEKRDVNQRPRQPRENAGKSPAAYIRHRPAGADRRKRAFVIIGERLSLAGRDIRITAKLNF